MAFSPHYIRLVLRENFEDAKRLLLDPLMAIHFAHLAMLAEQGIVARADARAIRSALDGLDVEAIRRAAFDDRLEDLFFYVDQRVIDACGAMAAGQLHTARSRNDIDMTMYRMRLRGDLLALGRDLLDLRRVLIDLASAHLHTIYPAHTHTQPAQPSTVAHYLLAFIEQAERDTVRLQAAYATANRNPLGACAITGTGFPIDRDRTSALLGFDGPTGNTYGSIASVDYVLEAVTVAGVALTGLGRLLHDLLLWCTVEVGYLRLPEGYVQGSSIMPQKRNPVALEHARALASKAVAEAWAVAMTVHNTPFGDIVDTEDDLQPLVASVFADASRSVALTARALEHADFAVDRMRQHAAENWVTVTELADTLVRDYGLPFGRTHAIASAFVARRRQRPDAPLTEVLDDASVATIGRALRMDAGTLDRILSPTNFVAVRKTRGGPAPEVAASALAGCRASLETDTLEWNRRAALLAECNRRRREAVDAI